MRAGSVCLPGGWFSATHSQAGLQHRPFVPQGRRREGRGSWLEECFLPWSHRRSHHLGAKRPLPVLSVRGPPPPAREVQAHAGCHQAWWKQSPHPGKALLTES